MSYQNIIVDCNLWYCRNHATHSNLTYKVKGKTIVTGGIYGFLKSLDKWERNFANEKTKFYFLFDNPTTKSNLRQMMIDPQYKANRSQKSKSFYRAIDYLRLILSSKSPNYTTVFGTGYEADDIVPYILKKVTGKTLLISEDLDWARVIKKDIDIFMKKEIYDIKKFEEKFGFKPSLNSITLYKVIRGDGVDNIPIGIINFPTKKLIRLVDDYKDIFEVLHNIKIIHYLNDNWKQKFIENKNRLILNHKLVSFFPVKESEVDSYTYKGKFEPKVLKILYETLGFEIDKIDYNVYNYFKEKERKEKGYDDFFQPPKMKRT